MRKLRRCEDLKTRPDWDWSGLTKEEMIERIQERIVEADAHRDEWMTLDEFNKKVEILISRDKKACAATR